MFPKNVHHYVMIALEASPELFTAALDGLTEAEADRRPDPDRFTIREVLAHLADWETVFGNRMKLTATETEPTLQGYDEGQWAIDHDYAHSDWHAQLVLFRTRRAELVAWVSSVPYESWDRVGKHTEAGPITLGEQIVLITAHDTNHLKQVVEWRAAKE